MTDFIDIHTEIAELRAELSACLLTRKERADALQRIENLLAAVAQTRNEAEGG
ncbi:hypothetical protein V5F59_22840 [Xanthobacter autotrophicus DSM 431]|uniref:hypothetical protein n=1 Tax=Xanthobacter nonsaccharivorans TaxID=3119912 RepID=UPI00372B8CF2